MAATNNIQRKDLTPLQRAHVFRSIRIKKGWEGPGGTIKLATYLSISPASIIQCEKFQSPSCTAEIRSALATGMLSAESAHLLMKEPGEMAGRLLKRARDLQVEQVVDKTFAEIEKGGRVGLKAEKEAQARIKRAEEGRIEAPSIKQAIREVKSKAQAPAQAQAPADPKPSPSAKPSAKSSAKLCPSLSRRELLDWFKQFDSDEYGPVDCPMRKFVAYLPSLADGKGEDKVARGLWREMTK
jgi:hypothetical protein